jgi:hypothetical protein
VGPRRNRRRRPGRADDAVGRRGDGDPTVGARDGQAAIAVAVASGRLARPRRFLVAGNRIAHFAMPSRVLVLLGCPLPDDRRAAWAQRVRAAVHPLVFRLRPWVLSHHDLLVPTSTAQEGRYVYEARRDGVLDVFRSAREAWLPTWSAYLGGVATRVGRPCASPTRRQQASRNWLTR